MPVITVWQWWDGITSYLEGEYWGMVGGDSDTAKIVRCTKDQQILEQRPIDEHETVVFNSGHRVKITNSNGTMCTLYVYPSALPSLNVDNVFVELSPAGDLPQYNRYGVYLEVHLSGTGTGTLRLSWGTDHTETKTGVVAGNYAYVYNLPPGTHNVCAELLN